MVLRRCCLVCIGGGAEAEAESRSGVAVAVAVGPRGWPARCVAVVPDHLLLPVLGEGEGGRVRPAICERRSRVCVREQDNIISQTTSAG